MASAVNTRILKKMGFLADQGGIINRYLREQGGWDSHLYKCREYILSKVRLFKGKDITILGSGWLLDVPLEELAEMCRMVKLVDINHPAQVRRKVKSFTNVKLINADITGGLIEEVWRITRKKISNPDNIEIPVYSFDFDPGLVISLNILTQTDTLLNDYLRKTVDIGIDRQRLFRSKVQQAHLDMLNQYPYLLLTDYEEEIVDIDSSRILETNNLIFAGALPQGRDSEEWEWIFDSSGEYYRRKRVIFRVRAVDNLNK